MTTIAKLKEGELKIAGEIEELTDETIQPTFTRASTAYKEDGTSVASGVPRIESSGVKIEEGTTNLIPENVANGKSLVPANIADKNTNSCVTDFGYGDNYSLKSQMIKNGNDSGFFTARYSATAGITYTFSVYVYSMYACEKYITLTFLSDSIVVISTTSSTFDIPANTWTRCSVSVTAPALTATIRGGMTGDISAVGDVFYYDDFQIEVKAYATSFTPTTRPQETLTIPASVLDYREGTIEFDYTPINQPLSDMTAQLKSPKIMQIGDYAGINSLSLWRFPSGGVDRIVLYGNYSSGWRLVIAAIYSFSLLSKYRIALRWKTANTFDVWIGGVPVITNAISSVPFTSMGNIILGDTGASGAVNAIYSNIRISNKARSDTELAYTGDLSVDEYTTYLLPCKEDLVASSTFYPHFRLSLTGGLKTTSILTEQPTIPSDVYYYPLTFDGKDITGVYSPVTSSNLVFSNEGVWVGTATQNYYTGYTPSVVNGGTQSDVTQTVGEYGFLFEGAKTWKFGRDGTTDQFHGWGGTYNNWISGAIGAGFTSSGYYKTSDSAGVTEIPPLVSYTTDWSTNISSSGNNIGLTVKGDGKWNFYSSSCTLTQASTGANANFPWTDSSQAGTCYYHAQMWEKKPFPSPFCNGSRGAGSLSYNFNSTLGLDWNGDWTICYWKKPMGTHNDSMTGFSIDNLGCNANSVGGGNLYFGKNSGGNSLYATGVASQGFTNYFNKWHMISFTKKGTVGTLKYWGIDGTVLTFVITYGTITSNYYVTQHGYDLQIGGWDGSYACNSYYKDLVVAKRALTDDELFALYKTQIKSYNSGILQVRNGISEGDIF